MDIVSIFLPDAAKKILKDPKIRKHLEDKEVRQDLQMILQEASRTLTDEANKPATSSDLRDTFNDVAAIIPMVTPYVLDGKMSPFTAAKLAKYGKRMGKYKETLVTAWNTADPALSNVIDSIQSNPKVEAAAMRIAIKTDGDLFKLEATPDGKYYATELVTGNEMKVPLTKEDYEDARSAIDAGKKGPPSPPPSPSPPPAYFPPRAYTPAVFRLS